MKAFRCFAFGCLVFSSPLSNAWASPYQGIVAFGDSLTDSGNFYALTGNTYPANPPYAGDFSNGPTWVEQLAARLGLPSLGASLNGGSNYAYGFAQSGSGNGPTTVPAYPTVPNAGAQIADYLAGHTPNTNQLFVVWAGGNDFFFGQTDPSVPVANIATDIATLAAAGAHDFLVPNLPALGNMPLVVSQYPQLQAGLNALAQSYNILLAQTLAQLEASLAVNIYSLDVAGLYQNIIANPAAYGLANVTDPAKSGPNGENGAIVPNPDQYFYWDGTHPTQATHGILANAAINALGLPEPASLSLVVLGLAVFGPVRRRAGRLCQQA